MKINEQLQKTNSDVNMASRILTESFHKMNRYCDGAESLKFILLVLVHKQIYDDKLYKNISFGDMEYVLEFSPVEYKRNSENIEDYVNNYLNQLSRIGVILNCIDRENFSFEEVISDQEQGFILKNEEVKSIFCEIVKKVYNMPRFQRGIVFHAVLEDMMSHFFDYPCKANELTPNRYIAQLMDNLLNANNNDVILDGAIGTGFTVGLGAKLKPMYGYEEMLYYGSKIYGIDHNRYYCQIAALYLFLTGHRFKVSQADFIQFADKNEQRFDKISMEIPVGLKVQDMLDFDFYNKKKWLDVDNVVELEWLYVLSAFRLLSEKGRAVLLVPEMVLHRNVKMGVALRKHLIESHCISKIISVYYGRREKYALIVLEKNSESIFMVDTISNKDIFYLNSAKSYSMSQEGLEQLINILGSEKEKENLSAKVPYPQIIEYIYELSPKKYIQKQESVQQESMENLSKRLLAYHERLGVLKKEMEELPLFKIN